MKGKKTRSGLFAKWLQPVTPGTVGVAAYVERAGSRATGLAELKPLLADHFVGQATVLKAGGYAKAAQIILNSLPEGKRTRSGDLGELLATEYLNSETSFSVPIKKLRWKSDRQMPIHGNDVIGVDATVTPVRVLKGECKSRASFGPAIVKEAGESLDLHDGRANPSTLAFIAKRLYEEERDDEANVFRDLQCKAVSLRNMTHSIFALAGNDPTAHLAAGPKSKHRGVQRESAVIIVKDHGKFVAAVFTTHGT